MPTNNYLLTQPSQCSLNEVRTLVWTSSCGNYQIYTVSLTSHARLHVQVLLNKPHFHCT